MASAFSTKLIDLLQSRYCNPSYALSLEYEDDKKNMTHRTMSFQYNHDTSSWVLEDQVVCDHPEDVLRAILPREWITPHNRTAHIQNICLDRVHVRTGFIDQAVVGPEMISCCECELLLTRSEEICKKFIQCCLCLIKAVACEITIPFEPSPERFRGDFAKRVFTFLCENERRSCVEHLCVDIELVDNGAGPVTFYELSLNTQDRSWFCAERGLRFENTVALAHWAFHEFICCLEIPCVGEAKMVLNKGELVRVDVGNDAVMYTFPNTEEVVKAQVNVYSAEELHRRFVEFLNGAEIMFTT